MISVRMRAELKGLHVSGAERIVDERQVERVVKELIKRPKDYDKLFITLERLEKVEIVPKALTIYSYDFDSVQSARDFAVKKLKEAGIKEELTKKAIELLERGANPRGGNMRGAILMDANTGERLEPDQERGIRTVRIDWKDREAIKIALLRRGIKRRYLHRLLDALALATKNVYCGVLAELCWSDDPDYITGYVAGKNLGYVRIKPMKEPNTPLGGRVYFVERVKLEDLINCLEKKAVLIESL